MMKSEYQISNNLFEIIWLIYVKMGFETRPSCLKILTHSATYIVLNIIMCLILEREISHL